MCNGQFTGSPAAALSPVATLEIDNLTMLQTIFPLSGKQKGQMETKYAATHLLRKVEIKVKISLKDKSCTMHLRIGT